MALTKIIGSGIGTVTNQFADGNMAAGSIVQIVQSSSTTLYNTTSSSFANVFTGQITPTSSSNKILIVGQMAGFSNNGGGATAEARLNRNLSGDTVVGKYNRVAHIAGGTFLGVSLGFTELDSPSTTSQITYEFQVRTANGTDSVRVNDYHTGTADTRSTITMFEVVA